jgi:hypothetical protein
MSPSVTMPINLLSASITGSRRMRCCCKSRRASGSTIVTGALIAGRLIHWRTVSIGVLL